MPSVQPARVLLAFATGFLFVLTIACAPRGPKDALDEYRAAVLRKDAAAVRAMSDASYRAAFDEAAVLASLDAAPPLGTVTSSGARASFRLESGERIELVLEEGAWKIASGGVTPARYDTPEGALETFFRAALAGRLDDVRPAIPRRFLEAMPTDEALEKHIAASADRIARARARIGPIAPGRAAIHGRTADLTYGPGLAVTFELEDARWVIVDLE